MLIMLIELCHGCLSMPMCHGYHIEGSYRVVHWRASAGLLLSYPTISLSYNITNILISTPLQQHNNNDNNNNNNHITDR